MGLEAVIFGGLAALAVLYIVPSVIGFLFARVFGGLAYKAGMSFRGAEIFSVLIWFGVFASLVYIIGVDPFGIFEHYI